MRGTKKPLNTIRPREVHKNQVVAFLQQHVKQQPWSLDLPPSGRGQETYFARSDEASCFIKVGAESERYRIMSESGVAPEVIAVGYLENGIPILVQRRMIGRMPSRKDFQERLDIFAHILGLTHRNEKLKAVLPQIVQQDYKNVALAKIAAVERRWLKIKSSVLAFADEVDQNIQHLKDQVEQFTGRGLVASHNDPCNANWLVAQDGKIYLLDYELMSLEDPAIDLGAILWWYYPPECRTEFISMAGYKDSEDFRERMRIRMAIHALNIIIPRENSFDRFNTANFDQALVDFRALVAGKENPQGYDY